jgi:(p)ppGpp synthase/HD superfamily hydrolase
LVEPALVEPGLVERAARLAADAHEGAVDRYGRPFFEGHVSAVARRVADGGAADEVVAAAYLHDVVEKTDLTLDDLTALGMPERVRLLVGILTWDTRRSRREYLEAIRADRDALVIKQADHRVNADPRLLATLPGSVGAVQRVRYQRERRILFADG